MSYQRLFYEKPSQLHPLEINFGHHGQFSVRNDAGWLYKACEELMEDGNFALHTMRDVIERVKKLDVSDYRDEVAKRKKAEPVLNARMALLTFIRKHIDAAKADIGKVRAAILRETEPLPEKDSVKAMLQELKNQEIRGIIRSTEPKHRDDLIRGNIQYIQACIDAPDDLISQDHLEELRRELAFTKDPALVNLEKDTEQIYKAVRKRAGEINATAVKMLIEEHLDDPVPPAEHYSVFEPETPYDRELANRKITSYQKQQDQAAKKIEFEEREKGINFEIKRRAARR